MPSEDVGYRDSPPPPPPPPASTHPLYQPGSSGVGQKLSSPSGTPDNRLEHVFNSGNLFH
jgi:hypothetical protein